MQGMFYQSFSGKASKVNALYNQMQQEEVSLLGM